MTIQDDWIRQRDYNLLWLPQEYRCYCSAFYGNTIAIGLSSGHVRFIQLDDWSIRSERTGESGGVIARASVHPAQDHPDRLPSQHQLEIFYWKLGPRDFLVHIMQRVVEIHR